MIKIILFSTIFLLIGLNNIILFLVNYHIYCIYTILAVIVLYGNYIFFLKYQYAYLSTYIYIYWFLYLNTIYINLLLFFFLINHFYYFLIL